MLDSSLDFKVVRRAEDENVPPFELFNKMLSVHREDPVRRRICPFLEDKNDHKATFIDLTRSD